MDDLCLLTPPEIAKKIGAKKTTDLTSGVKNLSASSLNNLKISNPTKYEIVMLGLIVKKLHIITPPPNNLKNQQAYLTLGC